MALQPKTFNRLPPRETILAATEAQRKLLTDITSYLWYIMPVAERFGDQVFVVAAESLRQSGVDVTAAQLQALAAELNTPEGKARYAENRATHITGLTSYKRVAPDK